jgi:hypothetical protein
LSEIGRDELSSMLCNFHPSGFGEAYHVGPPITQDTMKQIYANEEQIGHLAQKNCILQIQNTSLTSNLEQEKRKLAAYEQRLETQVSRLLEEKCVDLHHIARLQWEQEFGRASTGGNKEVRVWLLSQEAVNHLSELAD